MARSLIPCSSLKIFLIIFLILVAIVVFILLLFGAYAGIRNLLGVSNYYISDDSTFIMGIMIIVIYLLVALLEVFFLYIIWKLYKHLRQYEGFDEKNQKWTTIGELPKDNTHGSPTMGDIYPYGEDGEKERML
ncbi:hypothetical protein WR25_18913 [Diploscapter pachys]|uniref:Uncharacterized protein n=1 Tax=Diploscapter pachys TaxID=2018661 RepID=A0A2A2KHL4_9BILA|nr:hypothetical protein WR25_18913 [Diploscapter pachys]